VERSARAALAAQGLPAEQLLVQPTIFNSLLWRVVVLDGDRYHEGFRSLLDASPQIHFDSFDRGHALREGVNGSDGVQRIAAFSKGFYKLYKDDAGRVRISDLRIGQEPAYFFSFAVANAQGALQTPLQVGSRPDLDRALPWLWQRMWGQPLPPPR